MSIPNRTTLAQLRAMTAAEVARLPLDQLALLLDEVGDLKADAKRLGDLLHDALHVRFGEAATAARRAEGKDTGRVRLEQDGFEILADLPKKVRWDQPKLAEAIATLRGWGEDPADYVATELRVPEARFSAWPPRIRALFEPARTVAAGRPSYSLELKDPA
ncbi:hypothetical protein FK498_00845 [Elioraea sp. Yellowstone]|jgi:hypothetical protein|uniref:hypothetical protein n=1 Tax=unclassified Elioraea TaxID=2619524 RepID=UPI0011545C7B|nr:MULTISPECIES: hypothetical protein [unclassified Elioraea]TQF85264.1 hypothetical protein FK498_00845 [Elioraea sp. Yellowstone]GIX11567.1 MAG: hypothetical protein KatS3mg116_3277 [Elioraea sp.]